jgi:hypothetical protein
MEPKMKEHFSASNREKAKNQNHDNGVKKQTNHCSPGKERMR